MKNIRNWIVSLAIIATIGGSLFAIVIPQMAFAVDGDDCNTVGFLGFPAWYTGLTKKDGNKCVMKEPGAVRGGFVSYVWIIGTNILQIALMSVGYFAVVYMVYGGFLLMTGRGKPDEIAQGQITIRNAVIGLVMSFGAVAVVNFIGGNIIGNPTSYVFGIPVIDANSVMKSAVNVVYMVSGIVAVVVIIIAGYMYTISGGNPAEVEKSKHSILYAVIGLIVIGSAFVITNFVIGRF